MLEKISHWLTGYARFTAEGDSSRFLNITARTGIGLWGFQKDGEKIVASVKARNYKKLYGIKRRTGVRLKCIKKGGLPFYTARLGKRKGLVLGAAVFIAIYALLFGRVWDVQVSGNDQFSRDTILESAKKAGVFETVKRNSFDPVQASQKMFLEMPGLSWVSVNTDGCTVVIEVKETEKGPDIVTEDKVSNIVAQRAGQIISIEAQSGMRRVSIGETVQKGQVLIEGIYTEDEKPYIEKQTPARVFTVPARGSVRAETVREFKVEVPREKISQVETDRKENRYLSFFGIKIPLGLNLIPKEQSRVYLQEDMLTLMEKKLPVGIMRERYVLYRQERVTLSEQECKDEALFQLRKQQNQILSGEDKIVYEKIDFSFTENACVITAVCRCREEIGLIQEIT